MDIEKQYEGLTNALKNTVPFKAFPHRELVQELRKKDYVITLKTQLSVKDIYNSGDITGIVCMLEETKDGAIVCALTKLDIPKSHPLSKEIRAYQKKRIKRLKKMNQRN